MDINKYGINEFILKNPNMSLSPSRSSDIAIKGMFSFCAAPPNGMEIKDSYYLKIVIPQKFPRDLPRVYELDGKIKRLPDLHIYDDGALCLGSPFRLMIHLTDNPTLESFSNKLIIPYLYAVSHQRRTGSKFIFGELAHGDLGIYQDYSYIFKLRTLAQIKLALFRLGIRKRLANKQPCPCGCGLRYGKCKWRFHLEKFRNIASRGWFRDQSTKIKL